MRRVVIRHTDPRPDGSWASIDRLGDGVLEPVAVTGVTVDLDELFDF